MDPGSCFRCWLGWVPRLRHLEHPNGHSVLWRGQGNKSMSATTLPSIYANQRLKIPTASEVRSIKPLAVIPAVLRTDLT